jgi:hypothetical protein
MNKDIEVFKYHEQSGYEVSNFGNVKGRRGKPLKQFKTRFGYMTASRGGKTFPVHRMVWQAFVGEIPYKLQINHIDGKKNNNNLVNLEVVTASENQLHALRIGLSVPKKGEDNSMAKLTDSKVIEIYALIKQGYTNMQIANIYSIHDRYVSLIRHKKRWQHLAAIHFADSEKMYSLGNNANTNLDFMFEVISEVLKYPSISLASIARKYKIDASIVVRIKNKQTWKYAWEYYEKRATTIESPMQSGK